MKRFLFILFSVVLCLSLVAPAMAAEAGEGEILTESENGSQAVVVPDVNVYNEIVLPDQSEELGTYVGSTVYSLNPVTPDDASGLKAVLLEFLGDWDSIVVEHQYESYNGSISYVREIQLDYPWLCSAAVFAIMIFCLFRLGGAVLCRK